MLGLTLEIWNDDPARSLAYGPCIFNWVTGKGCEKLLNPETAGFDEHANIFCLFKVTNVQIVNLAFYLVSHEV